ncbi:MFS transporter [Clostridium sp. UBA7503]|uniref:MDR family MFS transporter n=1 Tax=Clostridium sp. UBA7503 TaxID=1946377 RepID=UPI003217D0B4
MHINKNKFNDIFSTYTGLPKEVYILFLGKMINCIGAFVYPLLSLIITQKVGMSIKDAGLILTLTAIPQGLCIILGGKLVDSIGRKKVIIFFQSFAAVFFIVCGFIKPSTTLIFFIILASCFSSLAQPAYDSMVGDITTSENRKASFSLIYMGLNLGFAIGPFIGGLLFESYLPLVFIGDAITTLISIGLISLFIKETHPKLINSNSSESDYENQVSSLEKEETGSVFRVFLKRPILIYYALLMLTFQFAYAQWGFAIPLQLGQIFGSGNGARYFGILASCNGLIVILLTPIITSLTKKYKTLSIIASGGILYAIAFGSCSFISQLSLFFIVILIITIGEIAISTNSGTFIANLTPASHRGRVNAFLPLIYGTGNAIGPSIMGSMIDSIGMNKAWIIVAIVVGIGSVFMYSLNSIKVQA